MKRLLLLSLALLLVSSSAFAVEATPAEDTAPPPSEPVPYAWTGLYGQFAAPNENLPGTENFLNSGQFGYNFQKGPLVFGIEGDLTWRNSLDSSRFPGASLLDAPSARSDRGWIGTLRPRAGFAIDNWLLYGTGGLAFSSPTPEAGARTGWTVGGGIQFDTGKQWSLGLEYLYADFGKSAQNQGPLGATGFATLGSEDRSHLLRGKLNYRFGWDGAEK